MTRVSDGLAFMSGDGGQDVNGQPISSGHIDGDEIDAALHLPPDELNIAGKPVEPADDNDSFVSSAYVERVGELHFPPILDVSSEAKFSPCLLRIL